MNPPIDIRGFPKGAPNIDYESDEEREAIIELEDRATAFIERFRWAPPVGDLILAFSVTPIIALFLVRFTKGLTVKDGQGDTEVWVVVGDLPSIYFETDSRTPTEALEDYCRIAEDWAVRVMEGEDLSESYPIPVEPTREHAKMLLSRVDFIREKFIPLAA